MIQKALKVHIDWSQRRSEMPRCRNAIVEYTHTFVDTESGLGISMSASLVPSLPGAGGGAVVDRQMESLQAIIEIVRYRQPSKGNPERELVNLNADKQSPAVL